MLAALLFAPLGVDFGPHGSLYIADTANHRIRRVAPDGITTTIAGSDPTGPNGGGFSGDGGPATSALHPMLPVARTAPCSLPIRSTVE
ncbi:MAG: hypothetical protein ACP5R4_12295 [Armatimonadota bacterium]